MTSGRSATWSNVVTASAVPVLREHRVQHEVAVAVVEALRLALDALLAEAEALRDVAAGLVVGLDVQLDPVELERPERVVEHGAYRLRHRPAALTVVGQPVADARAPVARPDLDEADRADDAALAVDDRRLQAAVVGELRAGRADVLERGLVPAVGRPRHPRQQVVAVGLDEREQLVGVGLLEEPQRAAAGKVVAKQALSLPGVPPARRDAAPPGRGRRRRARRRRTRGGPWPRSSARGSRAARPRRSPAGR